MGSHPMVKQGMKRKAKGDSILNLSSYNPRACLIMTGCRKCCKDEKLGKSKEVPRAATPGAARLADGQGPTQPTSQLCNHKEEPPGDPQSTHLFLFFSRKKPPKHPMPEPVACSDVSLPSTEYSDAHPCTNPAKDFFLSSTGSSGWFNKHFMTFIYFLTTQPAQSSTSPCSHACFILALKLHQSSP